MSTVSESTLRGQQTGSAQAAVQASLTTLVDHEESGHAEFGTRLSQIVDAGQPWVQPYSVNDSEHTAQVLIMLDGGGGSGRDATLGFDRRTGLVRIDVRLGNLNGAAELQLFQLLELTSRTLLTRVITDREDRVVWFRAASVCEDLDSAGPVTGPVVKPPPLHTLEDIGDFAHILQQRLPAAPVWPAPRLDQLLLEPIDLPTAPVPVVGLPPDPWNRQAETEETKDQQGWLEQIMRCLRGVQ